MARFVVPLSSRRARDARVTGGKGAGLARLLKSGFPVPAGFVITTAAFREPLAQAAARAGSRDLVPDLDPDPAALEAARRACLSWTMPDRVRRSVLGAYRRLGAGPVAVRSSLVGEDSGAASFAGQLDTVLGVEGESALLDAVRRVLASAFGDRLWAYMKQSRAGTGTTIPSFPPLSALSLAVVVQSMVRSEVSGVAFSADPLTGQNDVVVEAVAGLGEDFVQGRVRPDRYRLDPRGDLAEVEPALPSGPLLAEADVRALAKLVRAIAAMSGCPQDIEWSRDADGFRILQSRPIASLAGRRVYSRRLVSEMAPGLVRPLVWSTKYRSMIKNVLAPAFTGVLKARDLDHTRLIVRIHSRVYTDMTLVGESFARIGFPVNYFETLSRDEAAERKRIPLRPRMVPAFLRLVRLALRILRMAREVDPFIGAQDRKIDEFRSKDWAAESADGLLGTLDRLNAIHADSQRTIISVSMNMAIRNRLLGRMIAKRAPGARSGDALKGYGKSNGLAPFLAMRVLAVTARAVDPSLLAKLAEEGASVTAADLTGSEPGRRLLAGFDRFMDRFGYLSANGSDFSEVPWIENPRLIWKTVARLAAAPETPAASAAEVHREEVLGLVRSGLGPLGRRVFDRLHLSTVRFIGWRERVSLLMSECSYLMRRCALALGRKLVDRGVFERPDDVFYLYADELREVVSGTGEGGADAATAARAAEAAAAKVGERRAELVADAAIDPPETVCGDGRSGPPRRPPSTAEGLTSLFGIGGSAGVVRGRARIVHDPACDGRPLTREDVLVVPFTDIGWTPVLADAGGIVAETGGQLSHTSIIAREFGIPAVVSVRDATRLIREGQTVTVDGAAGRVFLHPEEGL
jgi:pyruvate,water dikinase